MEENHKWLLAVILGIVIVGAAVLLAPPQKPPATNATNATMDEAKQLMILAINFGNDATDYTYAYSENTNNYVETYKLVQNGNSRYVETDDMMSLKKFYFIGNETYLCVDYMNNSACSQTSTLNETALIKYYLFLNGKFFNPNKMASEYNMMNNLLAGGYVTVHGITDATFNGKKCRMVSYAIDYSNMTITEAEKYGITSDAPKHFEWKVCVDNQTRMVYYKYFDYVYSGVPYYWEFKLSQLGSPEAITAPAGLSDAGYPLLVDEMQHKAELVNCFRLTGDDKDKCVAGIALNLVNKNLCEAAGARRDRCLVSITPFLKDASVCTSIQDSSFKEDCYIEMAGATKNSSYCGQVTTPAKLELCMNASKIIPVDNSTIVANTTLPANASGNTSTYGNSSATNTYIQDLLNQLESENTANKTGSG